MLSCPVSPAASHSLVDGLRADLPSAATRLPPYVCVSVRRFTYKTMASLRLPNMATGPCLLWQVRRFTYKTMAVREAAQLVHRSVGCKQARLRI